MTRCIRPTRLTSRASAPDCGMDLVPKYADDGSGQEMAAGTVNIAPGKQQLMGVRTATVEQKPVVRDIRTTAQIVPDETKIAHIHVKVPGFVEKVYVDFVGQLVKKGQPVFTLYSPDMVATQEEYLIAKRGEQHAERRALSGGFPGSAIAAAFRARAAEAVGHLRRAD